MEGSSEQIISGLHEIFPGCEQMGLSSETVLGELPEWDSMAAVNLQTWLFQKFNIEVPLELLADETSLREITDFLENPVGSEAVQ